MLCKNHIKNNPSSTSLKNFVQYLGAAIIHACMNSRNSKQMYLFFISEREKNNQVLRFPNLIVIQPILKFENFRDSHNVSYVDRQ